MGRRYAGNGAAAAGTDKTLLALISAATIRPKLYDLIVGSNATPADIAALYHIERFTAVGTEGSGFTPVAIDDGDPASLADYGVGAYSAEPTYTANKILLKVSFNQRNTVRWVAFPGGELTAPATANSGLGLQCQSAGSTGTYEASMWHEE